MDDRTRTGDSQIHNPIVPSPISPGNNDLQQTGAGACRPACCADLDFLIAHWSNLPDPIKAGISAIVRSAVGNTDGV